MKFNIVLLEPEIPYNAGNIGRTCVATNSSLHLLKPLGFELTDKYIRRAGMDYWNEVDLHIYENFEDFLNKNPGISNSGMQNNVNYKQNNNKVYGNEGIIHLEDKKNAAPLQDCGHKIYYATTKSQQCYSDISFNGGDYIMFGKESAGIPEEILCADKEHCIRIPMYSDTRSLNLCNSVAIVLFEALRQNGFSGLNMEGELHRLSWK